MNCLNCGTETTNPKFCGRPCSTSYNNRLSPKRKASGACKACGTPIPAANRYCQTCAPTPIDWAARTKGEVLTSDTQKYRVIRDHARRVARSAGVLNECSLCGYSQYVECAHITDIRAFPDSALLSEINDVHNLIGLCPNHHWEFDHGKLSEEHNTLLTQLRPRVNRWGSAVWGKSVW